MLPSYSYSSPPLKPFISHPIPNVLLYAQMVPIQLRPNSMAPQQTRQTSFVKMVNTRHQEMASDSKIV